MTRAKLLTYKFNTKPPTKPNFYRLRSQKGDFALNFNFFFVLFILILNIMKSYLELHWRKVGYNGDGDGKCDVGN